jgi:hypothetical protein
LIVGADAWCFFLAAAPALAGTIRAAAAANAMSMIRRIFPPFSTMSEWGAAYSAAKT